MTSASLPTNEKERIQNLKTYKILDTPEASDFDNLAKLTSVICKTPIALVSLIDENRQWFKARIGLNLTETHRNIAFCGHTLLSDEPLIVNDASRDSRFADNPLVTGDLGIRFYAGVRLISSEGFALGTLCALHQEPHELDVHQVDSLKLLGQQVVQLLERHRTEQMDKLEIETQFTEMTKMMKFVALGQMSAKIAHEIINPLTYINLKSEYLLKQMDLGAFNRQQVLEGLEKINKTSIRVTTIIAGIQGFARNNSDEKHKVISLSEVIQETLGYSEPRFKSEGISVFFQAPAEGFQIVGNPVQISQVLLNLFNNAIDAISNLPEKWIKITIESREAEVIFRIQDSGPGIQADVRKKMFSPFFTTKTPEQGTGLGLGIAKEIIEAHQGSLSFDNDSVHTCFMIRLPLAPPVE